MLTRLRRFLQARRIIDGPWLPALPGAPRSQAWADADDLPDAADDDLADCAYLLAILARIPRRDLPDGPARQTLAEAIRAGRVDNLYTPIGADYHNIAWRDRPAWADPRQRLSAFVAEQGEQEGQG